jgi:hypothetical protein
MDRLVFRSLHNPAIAYTLHNSSTDLWDSWYRSSHRALAAWAGQFEVYNDYPVQHSHESIVIREQFADYCASLAKGLTDTDPALLQQAGECYALDELIPDKHSRSETKLQFFHALIYKETKTQYYNARERRVSTSSSKRHDKRWEELPSWADGSAEACYRLWHTDDGPRGLLESYALYAWIRERFAEITGYYAEHPQEYFKIEGGRPETGQAFEAMQSAVTAARQLAWSKTQFETYCGNAKIEETPAQTA